MPGLDANDFERTLLRHLLIQESDGFESYLLHDRNIMIIRKSSYMVTISFTEEYIEIFYNLSYDRFFSKERIEKIVNTRNSDHNSYIVHHIDFSNRNIYMRRNIPRETKTWKLVDEIKNFFVAISKLSEELSEN